MNYRSALIGSTLALLGGIVQSASGQVSFRVISGLGGYGTPVGITEGSPDVFYSYGSLPVAFSVTTDGKLTGLVSFPNGAAIVSPLISGPDGRFFSTLDANGPTANVFSVGATPGTERMFPPQNVAPTLSQNLPDGSFLGQACSQTTALCYLVTVALDGTVTTVYQFPPNNLSWPPLYGADGNYYGIGWSPLG